VLGADCLSIRAADVLPACTIMVSPRVTGTSSLHLGATHTGHCLDPWGDKASVLRAKNLLKEVSDFHNQHIMGWGTMNPEPSPGSYDWETLDRRMALFRTLGGTPVITLCGAPDWMKGGSPGQTDWKRLETAPIPEHYDDFAALAAAVARRYPEVHHFQVWNEFKGLWNPKLKDWDAEAYTALYNKVYDALKSVSPDIKVGGPYLVLEGTGTGTMRDGPAAKPIDPRNRAILQYWLSHKHGADFFCVDRALVSYHDHATYTPEQILALTPLYQDIVHQLKELTDLPIWWSEYYGQAENPDLAFQRACQTSILLHMVRGGAAVALLWEPQWDEAKGNNLNSALFTDTRKSEGGMPLPWYEGYREIYRHFSAGTQLLETRSSDPMVEVLASPSTLLIVNKRAAAVELRINERPPCSLEAYGVKVLDLGSK
jgi:Glycosyl hydrolases family 39